MTVREIVFIFVSAALGAELMAWRCRRKLRRMVLDHCRRGFAYLSLTQERKRLLRGIDIGVAFDPEHSEERDRRLREGNYVV